MAIVTAVVPTLGTSPLLRDCLEALRRDGGDGMQIVLVVQGGLEGRSLQAHAQELPSKLVDQRLDVPGNLGFAGGTNLGIDRSDSDFVAAVNDDILVEPGWSRALLEALDRDPSVAACQGINLRLDDPAVADGAGLAWNRFWQAVQIGHGEPAIASSEPVFETFGVSATAAIYRRRALAEVARATGDGGSEVFDSRLGSYYEDVELAVRLRAAGYRALTVPAARARHAGSTTGRAGSWRLQRSIYGNRYLVLARLLGRSFWPALPLLAARDLIDLARTLARGDATSAAGIVAGWLRASRHLRRFVRIGPPLLTVAELRGFRAKPEVPPAQDSPAAGSGGRSGATR